MNVLCTESHISLPYQLWTNNSFVPICDFATVSTSILSVNHCQHWRYLVIGGVGADLHVSNGGNTTVYVLPNETPMYINCKLYGRNKSSNFRACIESRKGYRFAVPNVRYKAQSIYVSATVMWTAETFLNTRTFLNTSNSFPHLTSTS